MRTLTIRVAICLIGLFACADGSRVVPTARECVDEHPASSSELASASSVGGALEDCVADEGRACRTDDFIAPSAAVCIARADGLAEGLEGLRVYLYYSAEHGRLTWSVQNTSSRSAGDGASGAITMVDAETGAVLSHGGWKSTP
jgi:hypothetical protein